MVNLGSETTSSTHAMANVLAGQIRWDIFGCIQSHDRPLEMFQALCLLEVYEKLHSTRTLHERAHIYHANAITLMRRGDMLIADSLCNTPQSTENESHCTHASGSISNDSWWRDWIQKESIRRVVFATFMIDASHAAMFGHSATMVAHELRLILPCEHVLWSAASASEVLSLESALRSGNGKRITFAEALQRTLSGRQVRASSFGRSVIICGLLSLAWHMNQRDLQMRSLKVGTEMQERTIKWRQFITKAFERWNQGALRTQDTPKKRAQGDEVLASSKVLYHLAQISTNVEMVDCQIFAGLTRVLGRTIGRRHREEVQNRIRKVWAPSHEARVAVFFAVQFLCSTFQHESCQVEVHDIAPSIQNMHGASISPMYQWTMYTAGLVVWCYSYAVDGPAHIVFTSTQQEDQTRHMENFLERVKNIQSPEEVTFYRLNGCAGLLRVLTDIFTESKWHLLHEGAALLEGCVSLLNAKPI